MPEKLKTRREHLKLLPLQKRLQAIENLRKEAFPSFQKALEHKDVHGNFLMRQFSFHHSREGVNYWFDINAKYFQDGK